MIKSQALTHLSAVVTARMIFSVMMAVMMAVMIAVMMRITNDDNDDGG